MESTANEFGVDYRSGIAIDYDRKFEAAIESSRKENDETRIEEMNAVIYARVSSREQREEGYSIEFQLKYLREYAERIGANVEKEFIDIETAKNPGRRQFGEMIDFLKRSKKCNAIFVEKTDRLYRNVEDHVTVKNLGVEVHLVKENQVYSKNSKSQTKLIHGFNLLISQNYVENLREEVIKGMHTKAESGIYPGRAPLGYRNEKAERTIVVDPKKSEIVKRIFEIYASGNVSLFELRKRIKAEFGFCVNRSYLHTILRNTFYVGYFVWGQKTYKGTHSTFISASLFETVQRVLDGHNKPKYRKQNVAFRGLMTRAHDDCTVTAEVKKGKYTYYRCTGYRGKCELPRFTEQQISEKLADVFRNIQIPDDVFERIRKSLESSQERMASERVVQRQRFEQQLSTIQRRKSRAYADKLDGKIDEDFWSQQMNDWNAEELQIRAQVEQLKQPSADSVLTAQRCLELANKAYFLVRYSKTRRTSRIAENSTFELRNRRRKCLSHIQKAVRPNL